jgi:hypothetical protein
MPGSSKPIWEDDYQLRISDFGMRIVKRSRTRAHSIDLGFSKISIFSSVGSVLLTCRLFIFCEEKIPPTLSLPLEGGGEGGGGFSGLRLCRAVTSVVNIFYVET